MASETCFRLASDGAGYDDQGNNDAYRNGYGVGKSGPACKSVGHRKLNLSVADKFSKCKQAGALIQFIDPLGRRACAGRAARRRAVNPRQADGSAPGGQPARQATPRRGVGPTADGRLRVVWATASGRRLRAGRSTRVRQAVPRRVVNPREAGRPRSERAIPRRVGNPCEADGPAPGRRFRARQTAPRRVGGSAPGRRLRAGLAVPRRVGNPRVTSGSAPGGQPARGWRPHAGPANLRGPEGAVSQSAVEILDGSNSTGAAYFRQAASALSWSWAWARAARVASRHHPASSCISISRSRVTGPARSSAHRRPA
jgi:hypothetical protein